MRPALAIATLTLSMIAIPGPARAEHAKIGLDLATTAGRVSANVDQTPPDHGKNPRPVLKAKVGEPVKIQWTMTNVYFAFPGLF